MDGGVDGSAVRPAQLDLIARLSLAVAHRRLGPSSSAALAALGLVLVEIGHRSGTRATVS
jgi:hypothetical protein